MGDANGLPPLSTLNWGSGDFICQTSTLAISSCTMSFRNCVLRYPSRGDSFFPRGGSIEHHMFRAHVSSSQPPFYLSVHRLFSHGGASQPCAAGSLQPRPHRRNRGGVGEGGGNRRREAVVRGCSLLAPQPPWHAEGGHGCVGGWLGPLSHHPTKNVSDVSDVVLSLAGACHPCQIAI